MKRLLALVVALAWILNVGVAQGRYRQSLGPALFRVEVTSAGERVTFPTDFVFAAPTTDVGKQQRFAQNGRNKWNTGPCVDGLAVALSSCFQYRANQQVPVVEVLGRARAIYVGGIGQPGSTGVAYWPGKTPIRAAIVGVAATDGVIGVSVGGSLGGIDRLVLCGMTILGPPGSTSIVSVYQGTNTGRLCIAECTIEPLDKTAWGRHGSKWPVRTHGHLNGIDGPAAGVAWTDYGAGRIDSSGDGQGGGLEFVDCVVFPGQEHAYFYGDDLGPNSRIVGIRCHPDYDRTLWVERTLVQVCNRANPAGITAGGPSGYGPLEIADIESVQCGGDPRFGGNGDGYAITIAGHLGPINIHDLNLRGYHGGAIVCWTDANPAKGYWRFTADGFTHGKVTIANVDLESSLNTNPSIALGGVRSAVVGPFRLKGRNAAIDIDNAFAGPVKSGAVKLALPAPTSKYAGWQSASKMRRNGVLLSDAQIDALAVTP